MRRFHFTLEPVLRLRRRLEEEAQVGLARLQRQLKQAHAELERARQALRAFETYRATLQRERVEIAALVEADQYGQALAEASEQQDRRVRAAAAAVEAGLQVAKQRRIERETLERLREQRRREHREEELRAEQQMLDELSVLRWRRE